MCYFGRVTEHNERSTLTGMATDKDDDMTVNVRLPRDWLARADALVGALEKLEDVRAYGRVSRSMVLRLAVLEGIKVLELKHGFPLAASSTTTKGKKR